MPFPFRKLLTETTAITPAADQQQRMRVTAVEVSQPERERVAEEHGACHHSSGSPVTDDQRGQADEPSLID